MNTQTPRRFLQRLGLRRRVRALHFALGTCLLAGSAVHSLHAADGTWATDGNGLWSDSTNWQNNTIADGADSTANFAFDITAARTVTNDTARTIGNLFFNDTGATGDSPWTLAGANTNPLTFSTASGTSTITNSSTIGYSNNVVISALLAGSNNLVYNSTTTGNTNQTAFQVTNVANTYTGTTTVANGFLNVGANSILAAGSALGISNTAIVLGNANTVLGINSAPSVGLDVISSGAATLNFTIDRNIDSSATADVGGRTDVRYNSFSVGANGTLTVSGNWALATTATTHAFGLVAQQPGQTLNFTGNITGTGATTPFRINDYGNGNGAVRLSGTNTYAGVTSIEEGSLIIGNNAPLTGGALGNNATLSIGSNGTTAVGSAAANATLSAQTDGAYTVAKTVSLSPSSITPGGGVATQQAFSWTLGGSSANASTFTGNVNTVAVAFSRTLNLTQVAGGSSTFSGIIGANGTATDANVTTVEKTGAGTVVLSGANVYDGGTRITGGILQVNNTTGSGTGIGSVSVGVVSPAQTGQTSTTPGATAARTTRQIDGISLATAAQLQVGQTVTGTGIAANTTIQSIGVNGGNSASIVLSTTISIPAAGLTIPDLAFGALTTAGTLGGTGTINASATGSLVTVNTGSTLAPGTTAPGILSISALQTAQPTAVGAASLNLLSGSTLSIKLNGTVAGTGYDQVNVTGTVALGGGNLTLTLNGLSATIGQKFVIVNNDGTDTVFGTFAGQAEGSTVAGTGGFRFQINYNAVGGTDGVANDVVLTVTAVPEPGTWAMFILGLGTLGSIIYRRKRAA